MGHIKLSMKEAERIKVLDNLISKKINQKHASIQLNITTRQIRRIIKRYKTEGISGLVHKSRGNKGNKAMPEEKQQKIIKLIKENYADFGPTFAAENLYERNGIKVSAEKIRQIMTQEKLWQTKKRKKGEIHTYRDRKENIGEMIQLDGSPHAWFEERAPRCTLIAYIDDATSKIMDGQFVNSESTISLYEATEHYLQTHGKPAILYVDRHSVYKINRQATIAEELKTQQPLTQYGRAMEELQINLIFARSPQAKGRVERLFETLQDRLVKELRLEGISNQEDGTKYFREIYIPKHNAKFAIAPKDNKNLHKALLPTDDLARIFTLQESRNVSKDLVVNYKNTRYQLDAARADNYLLKNTKITVEESKNGSIVFRYKDKTIKYSVIGQIVKKPKIMLVASSKTFQERQIESLEKDPWTTPIIPAVAV
jgi:transposase